MAQLELGDAPVRLHVKRTRAVVTRCERGPTQCLAVLQQVREGEGDRAGMDEVVDPTEPRADN
jgi:hypothetical protein